MSTRWKSWLLIQGSRGDEYNPILINVAAGEVVISFKFPGIHIASYLTWFHHTGVAIKKAHWHNYLGSWENLACQQGLCNVYRCTAVSIPRRCISGCSWPPEPADSGECKSVSYRLITSSHPLYPSGVLHQEGRKYHWECLSPWAFCSFFNLQGKDTR